MPAIALTKNAEVVLNGKVHVLHARAGRDNLVLVNQDEVQSVELSRDQLMQRIAAGEAEILVQADALPASEGSAEKLQRDLSSLSDSERPIFERRRAYVIALDRAGIAVLRKSEVLQMADQIAVERGEPRPGYSSIYTWMRDYWAAHRDIRALIPRVRNRGNRTRRYPRAVQAITTKIINEHYLTPERPTGTNIYAKIVAEIAKENRLRTSDTALPIPKEKYVYRAIEHIAPDLKIRGRYGKRAEHLEFNCWKSGTTASRPLEVIELDHTQLNLMVVEPSTGAPIGRPTLTAAIDVYSRMIVGFYLSFESPRTLSVLHCLRHAIMPKADLCQQYETENLWTCYGVPETLVVDNGMDAHSKHLEEFCENLGIHTHYTQARSPWLKGKIESIFDTINVTLLTDFPGKTFSDTKSKGDYDPRSSAIVSMPMLVRALYQWATDIYGQEVHSGVDDRPLRLWNEGVRKYPPRLISKLADLDVALHRSHTRTLQRDGIEINSLQYQSEELAMLRRQFGPRKPVTVRWDEADLSYIVVVHPLEHKVFRVPAVDAEYTKGLNLSLHEAIREWRKNINNDPNKVVSLAEAKARLIREIREQWFSTRPRRGMKKIAKHMRVDSNTPEGRIVEPQNTFTQVDRLVPKSRKAVNDPKAKQMMKEREERDIAQRLGDPSEWGAA